ncbi:MAG TPA: glycosyltransferase family 4 protein, partial [Fimbriimonadaceae bacterium]|nr:glycosyltransferase family 4 protein [Fimbriimonadaceae bacterium]
MIHRILMTADTIGGVWSYSMELARALAQQGVEVVLATMGRRMNDDQRQEAARVPGLRVFENELKLEWMDEPWEDVRRAGEWLLSIQSKTKPDLVHLNGYAHGSLDWGTPVVVVCHSCVLSWWRNVKGEEAPVSWQRYAAEVEEGLARAGTVVAPSHAMLDEAVRYYGPFGRTRV